MENIFFLSLLVISTTPLVYCRATATVEKGSTSVHPLIPAPNGPFYGFPFNTAAKLPFTVSGYCKSGNSYTIHGIRDVFNHDTELECLYNAGHSPSKVPRGSLIGSVISISNSPLLNQLVESFWKGKTIIESECGGGENGNGITIGWNNVSGQPLFPFKAYLAPSNLNLAPGEYNDGKPALIIEYGLDFVHNCEEYKLYQNPVAVAANNILSNYAVPTNHMVDMVRFLGKQKDGGDIYLGKTLLKDPYREDKQAATMAYWIILNYDPDANPQVSGSSNKLILADGFKYMIPGIVDLFIRVSPVDNLFTGLFSSTPPVILNANKTEIGVARSSKV